MSGDLKRSVIQVSGPLPVDDLTTFFRKRLTEAKHAEERRHLVTWQYLDPCTVCGEPATNMKLMGPDAPIAEFDPCHHLIYEEEGISRYLEPAGDLQVMRDVESKLAILGRYEQAVQARVRLQTNDPAINATQETWIRAMEYAVSQLALAYQDHADYEQTWRP